AFFEPSFRMSHTVSGRAAYSGRRPWIAARRSIRWSVNRPLQSRHPMPALRQPAAAHSWVATGEHALCRSQTGHLSGSPGSLRRTRAGSVTIGFSFWRTTSGGSFRKIALLYDFDILRPSVPGTRGVGVSRVLGSGNSAP